MVDIKLLRVIHVFWWLRWCRLQGLWLRRRRLDMAHRFSAIALMMLTRVMRQGVIVGLMRLMVLRNVLNLLVLGALRFLLPLVVGGLL